MTRRRPRLQGSFWPTRTQELLLQTALAEREHALAAWRELQPRLEVEKLEQGTMSVLPLVYRALSAGAGDDPMLPRLKGIYRSTWVRNNLISERFKETLGALRAAGIEPVMIGSLAAAVRYYPELALRPTPALDLLIDPGELQAGTRALGRLGWSAPVKPARDGRLPTWFSDASGFACLLRTRAAVELELDRHALQPRTCLVEVASCEVRALAPTEDLLVACVSGARIREVRSVDWLVDIAQLLRTVPSDVDWHRLLELAAGHGQVLRLRRTLDYLSRVLDVTVPEDARRALAASPISSRERLSYTSAGAALRGLGSFPQAISEHLVDTRERSTLHTLAAFPGFLRRRWDVAHGWQLPIAGGRRAYRALSGTRER